MSVLIWRNNEIELLTEQELTEMIQTSLDRFPKGKRDETVLKTVLEKVIAFFDAYEDHYPVLLEIEQQIKESVDRFKGNSVSYSTVKS